MSIFDIRSEVEQLVDEKPEYEEILNRIVKYEEENPESDSRIIEDTEYDSYWEYDDVRVQPARLGYLVSRGILTKVFDSNSTTAYVLEDREAIKEALDQQ